MNWGKWIILSFLLFALFIGGLVMVCIRQEVNLVSKDYYQDELAYQVQIDRLNNTLNLANPPVITLENGVLQIKFDRFGLLQRGELKLFRPSDLRFDRKFILQRSIDSLQQFDTHSFPKGMYRARMTWSMGDKEYFIERIVNL